MQNKKILPFFLGIVIIIFSLSINPVFALNDSGSTKYYTDDYTFANVFNTYDNNPSSINSSIGFSIVGNNQYLTDVLFWLRNATNTVTGTMSAVLYNETVGYSGGYYKPISDANIIEYSNNTLDMSYLELPSSVAQGIVVNFRFNGTFKLISGVRYCLAVYISVAGTGHYKIGTVTNGGYFRDINGVGTFSGGSTGINYEVWTNTVYGNPTIEITEDIPDDLPDDNILIPNTGINMSVLIAFFIYGVILFGIPFVFTLEVAKLYPQSNPLFSFIGAFNAIAIVCVVTTLLSFWVIIAVIILDVAIGIYMFEHRGM